MDRFYFAGKYDPKIKNYRFWEEGLHPIELSTAKFIDQKVNYIHQNPVEASIVYSPEHYVWSSAGQYAGEYDARLEVIIIEGV